MNLWDFVDKHPVLTVILVLLVGGTAVDVANALRRRP
jgi:hypothetical protein